MRAHADDADAARGSETGSVERRPRRAVRRALADLSALTFATGFGMALAFAAQVLLTRALPPEGYGALNAAIAAITLVSPLAGFGVGKYWLRVFGAHGWAGLAWVRPSLTLAAIGTAASAAIVAAWSQLAALDSDIASVALVLLPTLVLFPASETLYAKLQVEANYSGLAFRQLLPNVVRFCVAGLAVSIGLRTTEVAIALSVSLTVLGLIFLIDVAKAGKGDLRLVGHGPKRDVSQITAPELTAVGRAAWPFTLSAMFYLVYYQSDVMLLGWLGGPEAAGIYNVAFAVMAAVFMVPSIFHQKYLLPKLHRWVEHDRPKLLAVYRFGNGASLALGAAVAILVFLLSPPLVRLIFGEEYSAAGRVLQVLAFVIPGRYLATSVGAVLATEDNMRRKVWLMGLSALVNLALNLLLIPSYGMIGAATATVVSETVLLAAYLLAVRAFVFGKDAFSRWTVVPGGWNSDG